MVDEAYLHNSELIKPERLILTPEVKFRVKYKNQAEPSGSQINEEKKNAKEKVLTYATYQFQNIKNGGPIKFPDFPNRSPQFSIDKIQNFLFN